MNQMVIESEYLGEIPVATCGITCPASSDACQDQSRSVKQPPECHLASRVTGQLALWRYTNTVTTTITQDPGKG